MSKTGRPTLFTPELAEQICTEIATTSKGLKTICSQEGMPAVRTVLYWLSEGDKKDGDEKFKLFLHNYTRARESQADVLADEILEIADETSKDTISTEKGEYPDKEWINRSRLRVDARKWIASKLKPKKYGDKIDVTTDGEKISQGTSKITLSNGTVIDL